MKRLVRDGRVLYIRRHFGWSFLFISLSLSLVLVAWLFPSAEKKELGVALYYGVPLAVLAMLATLRSQVFAIDRTQAKLMVLNRQAFRPRRAVYDLSFISVQLRTIRTPGALRPDHYIWIEIVNGRSTLFRLDKGQHPPLEAAEQLAADLGCPLRVEGN